MRATTLIISILMTSSLAVAQDADVPLQNWTVQPADTRGNGAPIQGGIFANSEARNWTVSGACGIPTGADAVSVNFTVVSTAATPRAHSFWPGRPGRHRPARRR